MPPAIRVHNLGKKYRIIHEGNAHGKYRTLRDSVMDIAQAPLRRLRSRGETTGKAEDFWALKNVSFDVQPGEVVGIIGRNGAGKSTLLKILSRITKPSTGTVELNGRVGSLLEVGTGFHPELTGRENIFLNGSILGMKRAEIQKQFDAIVDFSGVEKFLDTPVKRYSSGMYVRLAFAVAAHLEPEILIIDEVLAVGDMEFQKKCLGKMSQIAQHGRTVLFVSHNMAAVTRLCARVVLLGNGSVEEDGNSETVAKHYLQSGIGISSSRLWQLEGAPGDSTAKLLAVRVRSDSGKCTEAIDIRRSLTLEMEYEILQGGHILSANLHFFNEEGINAFVLIDQDPKWRGRPRPPGRYVSSAAIPGNFLSEGIFTVGAAISTLSPLIIHFYEREAVAFQIIDSVIGDSARGDYGGPLPGVVRPLFDWKTEKYA